MKLYKLTDAEGRTGHGYNLTQWGENVTHGPLSGEGDLCGPGFFHAYTDPLVGLFLNPIHANIKDPLVWEREVFNGICN